MKNADVPTVLRIIQQEVRQWPTPVLNVLAEQGSGPFHILIACVLSLRTKDQTTAEGARRLFSLADTPLEMSRLSVKKLEKAIYPVGFYRTKALQIREICHRLLVAYGGKVPDTIEELLTLKGVGRKTANLVVTIGFRKPGICVDVHVHRICNRLGYIHTKDPQETEIELRKKLPTRYWINLNDLLVRFGQNLCRPTSPFCSQCRILPYCGQIGVTTSR